MQFPHDYIIYELLQKCLSEISWATRSNLISSTLRLAFSSASRSFSICKEKQKKFSFFVQEKDGNTIPHPNFTFGYVFIQKRMIFQNLLTKDLEIAFQILNKMWRQNPHMNMGNSYWKLGNLTSGKLSKAYPIKMTWVSFINSSSIKILSKFIKWFPTELTTLL